MGRYHNRNIQTRSFNIGDMVLRRIQDEIGLHKLNSRWEGPFIITSHRTRILPTNLRGRTRSPQLMEHRASQEVLPISCQRLPPGFQSSIRKHERQLMESIIHRLSRIPTFLCSLKVKGTANRVVEAKGHEPCGPRDKLSTFFRSRYSIGYLEYQPFFVHSESKARRIE